jgi:hypothetical protein
MPGTPASIPQEAIDDWPRLWEETIKPVVFAPANAVTLLQLLRTARAPFITSNPATIETTVHDALWYSVFATNDITLKIHGQPFDNIGRWYSGSSNDSLLNREVERVMADPAALMAIDAGLQTSGHVTVPLVTLHTTLDQQVGFVQELYYGAKVLREGDPHRRIFYPVFRYGHCNFTPWEALLSFAILVSKVSGSAPAGAEMLLPVAASRQEYLNAAARAGILPRSISRKAPPRRTTR